MHPLPVPATQLTFFTPFVLEKSNLIFLGGEERIKTWHNTIQNYTHSKIAYETVQNKKQYNILSRLFFHRLLPYFGFSRYSQTLLNWWSFPSVFN